MKFPSRTVVYLAIIARRCSADSCFGSGRVARTSSIVRSICAWIDAVCDSVAETRPAAAAVIVTPLGRSNASITSMALALSEAHLVPRRAADVWLQFLGWRPKVTHCEDFLQRI